MIDYNKFIADAAREFQEDYFQDQENQAFLINKLFWMIDAEKHDWNPNDFTPEHLY